MLPGLPRWFLQVWTRIWSRPEPMPSPEQLATARQRFHQQRERLEARFFELASQSGRPRGLAWTEIDFADEVMMVRSRSTRELCAFVGCTIAFEAVAGGGMEEVEAVSNLRAATAVFRLDGARWATDGRVLFNLTPADAVHYYRNDVDPVDVAVRKA